MSEGVHLMQYTQLGERGPQVSRIALGNWSAGGDWGSVDRDAAMAAVREALDQGITLFDTARAYGFGAAEKLLGEALAPEIRSARETIVIATKGGLRDDGSGKPVRDSSPVALRRDLQASLRALGTDYVDLYQVHWPDPVTPIEATAETLDTFVREGKCALLASPTSTPARWQPSGRCAPSIPCSRHITSSGGRSKLRSCRTPRRTASASWCTDRWPTDC
jgi:hypothetical protein